jgi:gem associated protein 5
MVGFACRMAVTLMRVSDRRYMTTLIGHTERVTCFSFHKHPQHAGGTFAVSASADRSVRVWDMPSLVATDGHMLVQIRASHATVHATEVLCVSTSSLVPDLVVSIDKTQLVSWFSTSDRPPVAHALGTRAHSMLTAVACSPSDPFLAAVGCQSGVLWLVDVRDGTILHKLAGHEDEIQCLAWRPVTAIGISGMSAPSRCFICKRISPFLVRL